MKKIHRFFSFFAILTTLLYSLALPLSATAPPLEISEARSVLLINTETDSVVYEYEADTLLPPAASTRLMTAITAYEILQKRMDEPVLITEKMTKGYSTYQSFHINEWKSLDDYKGKYISVSDLFELFLLSGSDDAAQALAVLSCGSVEEFVSLMNLRAQELGMSNTVYTNPTGAVSPNSKTSARDVALLACEFYGHATLVNISSAFNLKISVGGDEVMLYNRNPVSSSYYNTNYYDSSLTGLLYGSSRTDACLIVEKTKGNLSYICIVMGADSSYNATDSENRQRNIFSLASSLLSYAAESFELKCVLEKFWVFGELPVSMSRQADYVTLVPREQLFAFLPKDVDIKRDITYTVSFDEEALEAPIIQATPVGRVILTYNGTPLGEVELVTNNAVSRSQLLEFISFLRNALKNPLTVIAILLLLAGLIWSVLYRAHTEAVYIREEKELKAQKERLQKGEKETPKEKE